MSGRKISPSLEDYLEAIYLISLEYGSARVKEIADFLNVKSSSVSEAIGRLKEAGLVDHERYGRIKLTDAGQQLAMEVYRKHMELLNFLVNVLGVPREIAERDACAIEHVISKVTLEKLLAFIERLMKLERES
ncbi:MAG: metal-dependent transcriptional regulator [archaeon GB-1867-005]|nr:metal-dependent transcriptional regulator [Candidatus Culexmicrobium cathedralense]